MTKPAQLLILDEIEARLANIKQSNGYYRTVAGVRRATLKRFQSGDLPMTNFWTGVDETVARGAGWIEKRLSVLVEIYDLTRDRPFVDVAFEMADDVCRALHRTTDAPSVEDDPEQRFGGLLMSLQLATISPQIGEGQSPWCGALLSFDATYKTKTDGVTIITP